MIKVLVPVGQNLLIRLDVPPKDAQTKGGIYIPDTAQDQRPNQGWLVSFGPDVPDSLMFDRPGGWLKIGVKLLFSKFVGMEVLINETHRYAIIDYKDVVGVIMEDKK